jgi:LPXTG-motif cell wall-anchored protein
LEVAGGGGAIFTTFGSTLNITNSTFTGNQASNGSSGGAIYSQGILDISNSTFDANESSSQGGAIFAIGGSSKFINNSTFVGNSATDAAAVFLSEGGLISNSTFWNNGDDDTFSIGTDTENTYLFGNILANDNSNSVKVIDPVQTTVDLGANLYTDTNFDDTTSGEGSSMLVTAEELKLSALALNQTLPTNTGTTKTVAVAEDSIAVDYYTADSPGAQEGITRNNLAETDQRGAFRPFGDGYDVGAFELGASQIQEPEVTERETLANTGIDAQANYLGLVGLGIAAILGGSAGVLRRRKKA